MDMVLILFSVVLSAVALSIALGTLASHRHHTKQPQEVAELTKRLTAVNTALTDLEDRVTHWMRRQSMRALREKTNGNGDETEIAPRSKMELRRRAFSNLSTNILKHHV